MTAHRAGGVFHAFQGLLVGNAHAVAEAPFNLTQRYALIDLRASTMYQHQANAQAVKQGDILNDVGKVVVFDRLSAKHNDKGFTPVCINVRRRAAKQANTFVMR